MKPWRASWAPRLIFIGGAAAVAVVMGLMGQQLAAERAETARLRAVLLAGPREGWSEVRPFEAISVPSRTNVSESTIVCSVPCRVVVPVYMDTRAGAVAGAVRAPSTADR